MCTGYVGKSMVRLRILITGWKKSPGGQSRKQPLISASNTKKNIPLETKQIKFIISGGDQRYWLRNKLTIWGINFVVPRPEHLPHPVKRL